MTDELMALADRVEALTGPCRETDALVANLLCLSGNTVADKSGWCVGGPADQPHESRRYTASLDAAMTLVPEGWLIQDIHQRNCTAPNWSWRAELWSPKADNNVRGIARQAGNGISAAAIAVAAAALRARASKEPEA